MYTFSIVVACNLIRHIFSSIALSHSLKPFQFETRGAMLFRKRLEVNYSKYANISQGADTHEYVNSNLNRFNRNAAKNYRYCCSPTKMIHLSTLPQEITEDEIVSLLEEHVNIVNYKVFEMNGRK